MQLETTLQFPPPGKTMVYTAKLTGASPDEIARAIRIFDAAALALDDKAPNLFTGPPPENTNPTDLPNYSPEQGAT